MHKIVCMFTVLVILIHSHVMISIFTHIHSHGRTEFIMTAVTYTSSESHMEPVSDLPSCENLLSPCSPASPYAGKVYIHIQCTHNNTFMCLAIQKCNRCLWYCDVHKWTSVFLECSEPLLKNCCDNIFQY